MKEIRTEDAVGHILCHDITQIIKDEKKGVLFKKGHVVKEDDIPLLLSVGKEHLFVWEKKEGILHENEAAEILYRICAGDSLKMHGTDIKEGKIEVVSEIDGVLKIRREALVAVNSLGEMMIASRHGDFPVKRGNKIAGTRIIPLVIEKEKMDAACGNSSAMRAATRIRAISSAPIRATEILCPPLPVSLWRSPFPSRRRSGPL